MGRQSLILILLASRIFAQDQAAAAREAAGCGPNSVTFRVKTDKNQHPVGQPEPGKALVYFFADQYWDNHAIHIGAFITRWGIDGKWVGATDAKAYFFVPVDSGDHRVCTSRQSRFHSATKISAAISLTAEAGKVYYFRLMTPPGHNLHQEEEVALEAVDPAAAQLLMAASAWSVSYPN